MSQYPLSHLFWIVPLALLALYIGSPRFLGTIGAARVKKLLNASLLKSRYTIIHDLSLISGEGVVDFDHIIVSRYGIFVIDTVHRRGWISGTDVQERWSQKIRNSIRRFKNPLHTNFLQVQVLEKLLTLPLSRFHQLVVFSGHKGFKNEKPAKVIVVEKLLPAIKNSRQELLTPEQVGQVVVKLRNSAVSSSALSRARRWKRVRLLLVLTLLTSVYYVYQGQINDGFSELKRLSNYQMAPEKFHPDGKPKTQLELQEERLICAYSTDTDRCACYEPNGNKVPLDIKTCRQLAQKNSVLKQ
jgi:restriction system protein